MNPPIDGEEGIQPKVCAATIKRFTASTKNKNNEKGRSLKYQEAMPVIEIIWRTLDYPCAERLHPVLLEMAVTLAKHCRGLLQ